MSKRTATNHAFKGLVERITIPAELHTRPDGTTYASYGSVVPIHCCTPEQVAQYAEKTHHYCDLFTEEMLSPLGELAYVRLDEHTAEKVFINRVKRILLVSSDGRLAQWRAAPSFESSNLFVGGAPLVSAQLALVSLVTAHKGNHYAVSTFEGEGGYFETPLPWTTLETPQGHLVYGDRTFSSRDELRSYIAALPEGNGEGPARPVLHVPAGGQGGARIALVASSGRQLAHVTLQAVQAAGVTYL